MPAETDKNTVNYVTSVGTGEGENPAYVHAPMLQRGELGELVARYVDHVIRDAARAASGPETRLHHHATAPLCPGCYMAVIVNALIKLARDNGQPFDYVAKIMGEALRDLYQTGQTEGDYETAREAAGRVNPVDLQHLVISGTDVTLEDTPLRRQPESIKPPYVNYSAPTPDLAGKTPEEIAKVCYTCSHLPPVWR